MKTLIFAVTVVMQTSGEGAGTIKDIDLDGPFNSKKICINNYLGEVKSAEISGEIKDLELKISGDKIVMRATDPETAISYIYSVRCKSVKVN